MIRLFTKVYFSLLISKKTAQAVKYDNSNIYMKIMFLLSTLFPVDINNFTV